MFEKEFPLVKIIKSSDENVTKFVFEKEDAVAEAVLYKYPTYEARTVICCSTQSGCPVGCSFCGTGKQFVRNLTAMEILCQIEYIVNHIQESESIYSLNSACAKFQIMFMSMGEPFLNYKNVTGSINCLVGMYPNAQLLISTVGIDNQENLMDFVVLSEAVEKIGLQFSIHKSTDEQRNELIPYKQKLTLREIRNYGLTWYNRVGRPVYLNYCIDGSNATKEDIDNLKNMFSPEQFYFTFSVVCSADETMKEAGYRNLEEIKRVMAEFLKDGYNVRCFDPAGQDDIGGGCGQLFHVQNWMKKRKERLEKGGLV